MEKVSIEEIKKIAELARIGINNEKEIKDLQGSLSEILDYFSIMDELKMEKSNSPFYPFEIDSIFREDKVKKTDEETIKTMVKQFPDKEGRKLKVKEILN